VHRRTDGGKAIGIALVDLQEGVRVMVRCPSGTFVGQRVTVGIVDEAPEGAPSRILPAVLEAEGRGTDD
ncbi:MAG: hypothetical protein ACRDY3_02930, partial [Acidimicrobiales bacterium]